MIKRKTRRVKGSVSYKTQCDWLSEKSISCGDSVQKTRRLTTKVGETDCIFTEVDATGCNSGFACRYWHLSGMVACWSCLTRQCRRRTIRDPYVSRSWKQGRMRERLVLKPGAPVMAGDRQYRIHRILDLDTVLAHDSQSGEVTRLPVSALVPVIPETATRPPPVVVDLVRIADEAWKIAQERFAVIRPFLATPHGTRAEAIEHARRAGVTTGTVYRWLQRYQRGGCVSALLPSKPSGGRGRSRLHADVEAVVQATIEDVYLSGQKPSVQHTCIEVHRRCRNAGLTPPHPNTVRSRIHQLSDHVRLRRREDAKAMAEKYAPLQGTFPGADRPLAVVQIDHTPVDLILVDDLHRRPVGRRAPAYVDGQDGHPSPPCLGDDGARLSGVPHGGPAPHEAAALAAAVGPAFAHPFPPLAAVLSPVSARGCRPVLPALLVAGLRHGLP
jgi:hypothetical protein